MGVARGGIVGSDLGIEGLGVDVETGAGFPQVDDDQANDQGESGNHLKVSQGLEPKASELSHVLE